MNGEDILEEYETTKEYIREKFDEDPDLTESDTKLVLQVIEDATGIAIPLDAEDIPKVGTITRVSRELRREEGYEDLADPEVTEKGDQKEQKMEERHGSEGKVLYDKGEIVS